MTNVNLNLANVFAQNMQVQGANGPLPARLYLCPPSLRKKRDVLVLFFHGGCFVRGNVGDSCSFLSRLATHDPNWAILSAGYTLASEKPFPAAVEDVYSVMMWAKKNKARLSWTGKHLIVAGVEAGANLAAVAAFIARDRRAPSLSGQILVNPMLDAALTTRSMRELPGCANKAFIADQAAAAYAEGYRRYLRSPADRTHPYASPFQSTRLERLPPALVLAIEDHQLQDEAERYGQKLLGAGVPATIVRLPVETSKNFRDRNKVCLAALGVIVMFIQALVVN